MTNWKTTKKILLKMVYNEYCILKEFYCWRNCNWKTRQEKQWILKNQYFKKTVYWQDNIKKTIESENCILKKKYKSNTTRKTSHWEKYTVRVTRRRIKKPPDDLKIEKVKTNKKATVKKNIMTNWKTIGNTFEKTAAKTQK